MRNLRKLVEIMNNKSHLLFTKENTTFFYDLSAAFNCKNNFIEAPIQKLRTTQFELGLFGSRQWGWLNCISKPFMFAHFSLFGLNTI